VNCGHTNEIAITTAIITSSLHILIHTLVMPKKKRQLPTSLAMFRKDLKKSTLAWLSPVQYKSFTSEEQSFQNNMKSPTFRLLEFFLRFCNDTLH